MKKVLPVLALSALLCGLPASARAQDADDAEVTRMAKEHYKAGLDAYKTGKYDVAIKELKKAYLLKRLPALLLNIGATYRKMGDFDLALHFYQKYLDEAPPEARDRPEVQKTIAEINVEKSGGGAAAETEKPAVKHEEEAPPAKPPAQAQEWQHAVIDAAPPETPLDVRVSMPVMKGVKVYVYYRGAGEESFKPVLMKRRGTEKVGRIPAEAVQGKAIQYYVEARDPAGTVVKNSGSQSNPNIVMVDPSAPPQMLASLDERREREAEPQPEQGDEQPRKKAKRNLDEESAPMTGNLDDENPEKRMKKEPKAKSSSGPGISPMFGAGIGVAALGAGLLGTGIAMGALAASKASSISGDSQAGRDGDGNKFYFNNDPSATGQQAYEIEAQGKLFDSLGIAFDVIGGVALAAGAVLMMVDKLASPSSEKPKKRHRPRPRPSEEEAKSNPWYIAPAASHNFAGVGAGFSF